LPSRLKLNVIANYGGAAWTTIISLIFVPLYIKLMGPGSYGLVGITASLQSVFGLLDFGLPLALNRRLAVLSDSPDDRAEVAILVRTIESIFVGAAACIILGVGLLSGPIALHWLKSATLSPDHVRWAVVTAGVAIAARWPAAVYSQGLLGLQRQGTVQAITCGCAGAQAIGAITGLVFIAPSVFVFLGWIAFVGCCETLLLRAALYRALGAAYPFRVRFAMLKQIGGFSAGLTGIGVTSIILTQADKIVVSKYFSLELFGYYTLAWATSMGLIRLIGPIQTAVFPRFAQLAAQGSFAESAALYHSSSQFVATILAPITATAVFFAHDILLLWTRDPVITEATAPLFTIFVIGTALNGLMNIPYMVQLAYGVTRLTLSVNILMIALLVPAMAWAAHMGNLALTAGGWIALNGSYVLIVMHFVHKQVLKGELRSWYLRDNAPIIAASFCCAGLAWVFKPEWTSWFAQSGYVAFTLLGAALAGLSVASHVRALALGLFESVLRRVRKEGVG
jgi:O-antigen/teichoic acid export membrane protein